MQPFGKRVATLVALEQEVKLAFATFEAARQAVHTAGGRLVRSRRLLDDRLFDTARRSACGESGMALRVRRDGDRAVAHMEGPAAGAAREVARGDRSVDRPMPRRSSSHARRPRLPALSSGRRNIREEFEFGDAKVMVDETPFGVFVEIEATPAVIDAGRQTARTLAGRLPTGVVPGVVARLVRAHGRPSRHDVRRQHERLNLRFT